MKKHLIFYVLYDIIIFAQLKGAFAPRLENKFF